MHDFEPKFNSAPKGFTLVEIAISMVVGSLFFIGLISFSEVFQKALHQVKVFGNYTVLKGVVAHQLKGMNDGNCMSYIQAGPLPMSSTSPVPISLMKTPVPVTSPTTPITPSMILFNADGSTRIDGNSYMLTLLTQNALCFGDHRNSCMGKLTLTMSRPGQATGVNGFFGLTTQSQDLGTMNFDVDDSLRLTSCVYQWTPWPAEVNYMAAPGICEYPPVYPAAVAPEGTSGNPAPTCPAGTVLLGACNSGMINVAARPPNPTPPPAPTYSPVYCHNNAPGYNVELGCCALRDIAQIKSSHWVTSTTCDTTSIPAPSGTPTAPATGSEVVTGICSGGLVTSYGPTSASTTQYPCPGGATLQCSQILDTLNQPINYRSNFCYDQNISAGTMTSCGYKEVMVGYNPPENGGGSMRCCPIDSPLAGQ